MNQNLYAPPESPLADQPFDQQPKRPVSVTIIAWILIAFCVLNLLFMAMGRWTPVVELTRLGGHLMVSNGGVRDGGKDYSPVHAGV
jgi:hypothetical protein